MKPFVINSHGKLVFPATILGELDFSVLDTLEQFTAVIGRDYESKAPTGTDLLQRVEAGAYDSRFALLRDLAQNLFWVNRYSMTMFDKRPTRFRDLPRTRGDVFLPVLTPWEDGERKVAAVEQAYRSLPATYDAEAEDRAFALLFDVFRHKRHHATELPAIKPTVAELLAQPEALTWVLPAHDPDFPTFSIGDILDADESVPELEALSRWAMVLHNQYPWERAETTLRPVGEIGDDDVVIALHPRNRDVSAFIERVRSGTSATASVLPPPLPPVEPVAPYPPTRVREAFAVKPVLEALSVVRGELVCSNDDVIRNASFSWSPMSAAEISKKTGIDERRYSERPLEQLALDAALAALEHSGRTPAEIGAVLVATCTSERLIPSVACWLSGQLGILQTHMSADIVAACAGLPYGLSEAVRLLQEVQRPVLLVCVEKFSDKIGAVRTSRMIFGDGAAAIVVAPGGTSDIELLQTYASGPVSEVNSIIWPNPEFDNDITVYGPEVKSLVQRYLDQMLGELGTEPDPDEPGRPMIDSIDLIVPHQANKTMILGLADKAGLSHDQLYFDIETMGNVSAASIPIAIADAVRDGVISAPVRVFAPGFGAGAVGGYAVLRVDPSIVAPERAATPGTTDGPRAAERPTTTDDVRVAFGE
ncbi:ketoacyl-ACP synthase III [Pseudonocardia sp. KRD-184]|uniref:Ketoacyl-ACP synthase III n=1 Tax=Pseudonocardia oceani TaxID=2792013 RepID=A0ABS6UCS4_9PSEU|nr:3-oxoacyl-[acyl-carrier-protein] synthase III C-terminal domain-containing protein [Pseudonocardia oceani]MBW0088580.1 ketoacyl-ACP synthase III [Pseudonocardia oceani]MBW0094435.1 ketoacyl-ACP synthase III [Pseudonocardia oceani]MBW0108160.1 ketoacyl-ACP synthase III [Pseudonocardia oceani]MBW0119958.1 ketoacyl-ACP synthase III [Pseudonocardia oceani]MBW0130038.1 ketoacyl-ACP synthase III [Pseudonocardia oceani]